MLDGCSALKSTLYFFYFCFGLMFCSEIEIHEYREEHRKGNNFFAIFCSLPYLTSFICYIYLFDGCFTIRSVRCVGLMFCYKIHEYHEKYQKDINFFAFFLYLFVAHLIIIIMSTVKNTKKISAFLFLCIFFPSTIFNYFSLLYFFV